MHHKKAADCSAALVMIVVLVSGHDVTFSSRHLFSWSRLFWPHPSSLDRPFWFHPSLLFLFSCRHLFSRRLFSWRYRHFILVVFRLLLLATSFFDAAPIFSDTGAAGTCSRGRT